jgi:hypothetical protein
MKLLLGAALLAALALAASACGSSRQASGSTVSSTGSMLGGTVQCTATLPTSVQAGHELDVEFKFHNVSKRTANIDLLYGGMWLLVRSPDGTTYDTRVPWENMSTPGPIPTPIAPGETKTETLHDLGRVRWQGPLRITPGCGLSSLRPVRVTVTSPGLPASSRQAVSAVVAATGHLLDHCRPRTSGVSVVGRIDPPAGASPKNAPPMPARCSITLRREGEFYDAQLLILTPPDLRGVHVEPPYEAIAGVPLEHRNTEAIAWEFVVPRSGATSVYSAQQDSTRSGGGLWHSWVWTGSEWLKAGGSLCGGSDGGSGAGSPAVVFVAFCGR